MTRRIRSPNPGNAANIFIRVLLSEAGALVGGLTTDQWTSTLEFFENSCAYTGEPLVKGKTDKDHAIPMSREFCGLNLYGNVVPATKAANNAKGGKHFREFVTDPARLARIEAFMKQAEYEEKAAVFGDLQRYCEAQYDAIDAMCRVNKRYLQSFIPIPTEDDEKSPRPPTKLSTRRRGRSRDTLPIDLDPSPAATFKKAVMVSKHAWITVRYADGRQEIRPWRANQIDDDSNIIGNLRSRPEFRSGAWQKKGIASVLVSIKRPT